MTAAKPPLPDLDAVRDHIQRLDAEANDYRKLLRVLLRLTRRPASAVPEVSGREAR